MLHKLDELQNVAADAAPEAVPALLVEHDLQRAARLAAVVRAVAVERLACLLCDAPAEQLTRHPTDIQVGDLSIVTLNFHWRTQSQSS
jgi:hypothetical protein